VADERQGEAGTIGGGEPLIIEQRFVDRRDDTAPAETIRDRHGSASVIKQRARVAGREFPTQRRGNRCEAPNPGIAQLPGDDGRLRTCRGRGRVRKLQYTRLRGCIVVSKIHEGASCLHPKLNDARVGLARGTLGWIERERLRIDERCDRGIEKQRPPLEAFHGQALALQQFVERAIAAGRRIVR
jgi:hypothetical protein